MGLFVERIAIDLGTAYSIVAHENSDSFWRIPSSVAIDTASNLPIAYGEKAKFMTGKGADKISVVRPLRDGVICDFEAAGQYVSYLLERSRRNPLAVQTLVLVCIPWGATTVETRSYIERLQNMRTQIRLIREPFAAALGAELDVYSPKGCTIVDIGGGTVEISTIAYGHLILCTSTRQAGNAMDQLIVEKFLRSRQFEISINTAEEIKMQYGSVCKEEDTMEAEFEVFGIDRRSGTPRKTTITTEELRELIEPMVQAIEERIQNHLRILPTEFQEQIAKDGITLVGGGAALVGWTTRLQEFLKIPVHIPMQPQLAVIRGMQIVLRDPDQHNGLLKISEAMGQVGTA